MMNNGRGIYAWLMAMWWVFFAAITPLGNAYAAASSCENVYTSNSECVARTVAGRNISYPRVQWTLVSEFNTGLAYNVLSKSELIKGANNKVSNQRTSVMADLSPGGTSNYVQLFKTGVPIVFGRYSPGTAEFRVDAFKIEKLASGSLGVYQAVLTPYHGDYWKASQAYLTDAEKLSSLGVNPMEKFKNGSDYFYQISFEGSMVTMGHFMRMLGAPIGYLVNATPRMWTYTTSCGGGMFKKCTEYHVAGGAKPKFYVATAADMLPYAVGQKMCSVATGANGYCAGEKIAYSGVNFQELSGGNIPEVEDEIYHWSKKKSSFTVLAMALVMMAVMWVAITVIGPLTTAAPGAAAGGAAGGSAVSGGILAEAPTLLTNVANYFANSPFSMINNVVQAFSGQTLSLFGGTSIVSGSAGYTALMAGVDHLLMSAVFGQAGATSAHSGFGGVPVIGSFSVSNGTQALQTDNNEHSAALSQRIRDRQIGLPMNSGGNLSAVNTVYQRVKLDTNQARPHDLRPHYAVGEKPVASKLEGIDSVTQVQPFD